MSLRNANYSGLGVGRNLSSARSRPLIAAKPVITFGTAGAGQAGLFYNVTTGSTAHTAGNWVTNAGSLTPSENVDLIVVQPASVSAAATNSAYLLDIGTGAAGSEVAIVSGIAIGGHSFNSILVLPVAIRAGTRVVMRARSARTSHSSFPAITMFSTGSFANTPTSLDVIGTSTANSGGTALSGSSGTYTQIASSTSRDYQTLIVFPSIAAGVTSGTTPSQTIFTVAAGDAGAESDVSEVVFGAGSASPSFGSAGILAGYMQYNPRHIPAGSRIAVKHNLASNPSNFAACVIGVPYA